MGISLTLKKQIGRFALDVSWEAGDELVALFGFSGAGKSLTLRLIAGLMRPDAGRVQVGGAPFFDSAAGIDVRARDRRLGIVFQDYALFPHMTVEKNIAYGLNGSGAGERKRLVGEMMARFRLDGLERAMPSEISGGQKQRVALARALIGRPALLMLDEPFSALDRPIRLQMREVIREVRSAFGIPLVLVTHDFSEVESLADRVIVYAGGRVVQTGAPAEVRARPAGAQVRELLGTGRGPAGDGVAAADGAAAEAGAAAVAGAAAAAGTHHSGEHQLETVLSQGESHV